MTFEDDFIQLEFDGGRKRFLCAKAGLQWPPPAQLEVEGFTMRRVSMSQITDEQRADMTRVRRGALYVPVTDDNSEVKHDESH